jgi:rod shape-determining protein MreD
MWIDLAFVCAGFALDNILRMFLPVDPAMRFLVFVPNLGFLAFLLVSLSKTVRRALILAFFLGLTVDFFRNEMLANAIAYPISIYVVKIWANQLNESLFELVFIGSIGLFLKEFVLFAILTLLGVTHIRFDNWFVKREFLTIIGHIPLLLGLSSLNRRKVGAQNLLDRKKKHRERVLWNPTVKP